MELPRYSVYVGGKLVETEMVGEVLRFKTNGVARTLVNCGILDLNKLGLLYQDPARFNSKGISKYDYAKINMDIGYSVDGFCDLTAFLDIQVEIIDKLDPLNGSIIRTGRLWNEEDYKPKAGYIDDSYYGVTNE